MNFDEEKFQELKKKYKAYNYNMSLATLIGITLVVNALQTMGLNMSFLNYLGTLVLVYAIYANVNNARQKLPYLASILIYVAQAASVLDAIGVL